MTILFNKNALQEYVYLKRQYVLRVLSPAEMEIFNLLEQGYTRSQIPKKLWKSENTVRNQIKSIYAKLGVSSTKEAIEKIQVPNLLETSILSNYN